MSIDFYHLGFAVPDLDRAAADLTAVAGLDWSPARDGELGAWRYRIAFTTRAPYLELIEGPPGSPWDSLAGARFDHLGWWAEALLDSSDQLTAAGLPVDFSGCPYGRSFVYHRVDSIGARVELVAASQQAGFFAQWDAAAPIQPALPLRKDSQ